MVLRLCLLLALAGCICFIFLNSLQVEADSDERSGSVTQWVNEFSLFGWTFTEEFIRKAAHFAEYMLLGFLALLNLRQFTHRLLRYAAGPVLLGLLVALADETLQLYVPGRSGQLTDVWLDLAGVLTGCLVAFVFLWIAGAVWRRVGGGFPPQ